jgi:hypothetical protein
LDAVVGPGNADEVAERDRAGGSAFEDDGGSIEGLQASGDDAAFDVGELDLIEGGGSGDFVGEEDGGEEAYCEEANDQREPF